MKKAISLLKAVKYSIGCKDGSIGTLLAIKSSLRIINRTRIIMKKQ